MIKTIESELESARKVLARYTELGAEIADQYCGMTAEQVSRLVWEAHVEELKYLVQTLEWIAGAEMNVQKSKQVAEVVGNSENQITKTA